MPPSQDLRKQLCALSRRISSSVASESALRALIDALCSDSAARKNSIKDLSISLKPVSFQSIALQLRCGRQRNAPPVIIFGAGASIDSGGPNGQKLKERIIHDQGPPTELWIMAAAYLGFELTPEQVDLLRRVPASDPIPIKSIDLNLPENTQEKIIEEVYTRLLAQKSRRDIYCIFKPYIDLHNPSIGYRRFAALCQKKLIRWVVTTNFDPLVEEALAHANIPINEILTFYRDFTPTPPAHEFVAENHSYPPIYLIKIHGDLGTRIVDATITQSSGLGRHGADQGPATESSLPRRAQHKSHLLSRFLRFLLNGRTQTPGKSEPHALDALSKLFQSRDIITFGHSMRDASINDALLCSMRECLQTTRQLNSLTLVIPDIEELPGLPESGLDDEQPNGQGKQHTAKPFLTFLATVYAAHGTGHLLYVPKEEYKKFNQTRPFSETQNDGMTFDAAFEYIYDFVTEAENTETSIASQPRRVIDFDDIYHIAGIAPNKQQIMQFAVLPGNKVCTCEKKTLAKQPSQGSGTLEGPEPAPIFFSNLSDATTIQLVTEALRHRRSSARLQAVMSGKPFIHIIFINTVCFKLLKQNEPLKNALQIAHQASRKRIGVEAVSVFLFCLTHKDNPELLEPIKSKSLRSPDVLIKYTAFVGTPDRATAPIKVYISENGNPSDSSNEQEYSAMGDKSAPRLEILRSLLALAGHKDYIRIVADKKQADIELSLGEPRRWDSSVGIVVKRFIPVLDKDLAFGEVLDMRNKNPEEISTPVNEQRQPRRQSHEKASTLLMTVGGAEHNKLLEVLIALHRWGGGVTVFNDSNVFDFFEHGRRETGLLLSTEGYVGGVVQRGGAPDARHRGTWDSFLVTFKVPSGHLDSIGSESPSNIETRSITVLAVVGLSAPGTILGVAYAMFSSHFRLGDETVATLSIPGPPDLKKLQSTFSDPGAIGTVRKYLRYLAAQESDDDLKKPICKRPPTTSLSEMLLEPVYPDLHEVVAEKIFQIDKADRPIGQLHAGLFADIADKFLRM